MPFTFRAARLDDSASIARVQVDSWRATYGAIVPADFLASMDIGTQTSRWLQIINEAETTVFVADRQQDIAGFVAGGAIREPIPGYNAELYALYLHSTAQKQGAGRGLVRSLAAELHAQRFTSLAVWVLAKNPSVGFYTHLGGMQIAEKTIDIGGTSLLELAFGWPELGLLLPRGV